MEKREGRGCQGEADRVVERKLCTNVKRLLSCGPPPLISDALFFLFLSIWPLVNFCIHIKIPCQRIDMQLAIFLTLLLLPT
jgi:hypothetical protein